jgi:microcystin-dependent protein
VNKVDDKTMILWRDDATSFQVSGGDSETRPKNIALNFIQKASADAEIPLGAVIPVGAAEGIVDASQMSPWLKCDGETSPRADFVDLFTLLGTRYDILAADRVNGYRPDLRGLFVRGVLHGRDEVYDPDANTRKAADGTNGKDFAGTTQRYATNVSPWTISIPHFPRTYEDDLSRSDNSHKFPSDCLQGHNNMEAGDYHTTQRWSNFAKETRPDNAGVNYHIAGRNAATFPVSGIIATVSSINDPSWLLCDGGLVARKDYPELCQRINYAWGGFRDTHCNLPDLGGRFLRGADGRDPRVDGPLVDQQLDNDRFQRYRVGINPEALTVPNTWGAGSLQDSAIGLPEAWRNTQGAVVATETNKAGVSVQRVDLEPSLDDDMELGIPSNGIAANVPHNSHTNAFGVQGHYVAQKNSDTVWTSVSSQDSITAPTRTYVNFYINAKP